MTHTPYFHPAVASWFADTFDAPTPAQADAWPAIKAGEQVLISAPTGSGKTLAAFMAAIDELVREGEQWGLPDETRIVYVSPLKALSNDIHRNLEAPLAGIRERLREHTVRDVDIRTWVRTGDTPQYERAQMRKRPPHIVVTTPESLYILLGSQSGREMLGTTRTVIVDEIHAVAGAKRGSHLAISLERLEALTARRLTRVGLSATQKPIEDVARFLVGTKNIDADGRARCTIVDSGHVRERDLAIELPDSPLEAVMSNEVWTQLYDRLAQLIREHRTTVVFVNTRRLAERVCRHLSERLDKPLVTGGQRTADSAKEGEASSAFSLSAGHSPPVTASCVAAHHGSLAKHLRFDAEQRLKRGELKALVATASLELGIDIGEVDLVCQISSPRSINAFLQRVGRSGHAVGGTPKGRLFPLSRDDLVECAALLDAVRRGELDRLKIPENAIDVLAQQIVAESAARECTERELFDLVRGAYPYRALSPEAFDETVRMLAEGFATRRGRQGALVYHDAVNRKIRGRKGARLTAVTSGGAIPDTADYQVMLEPEGHLVGTVNEDFAVESLAGDVFQLGNTSYRIIRVERSIVRVEDAHGEAPTIPFWLGEAPGRTDELSAATSRLRNEIAQRLDGTTQAGGWGLEAGARAETGPRDSVSFSLAPASSLQPPAIAYLTSTIGLSEAAASQLAAYLAAAHAALGCLPTQQTIVFERFFDEAGGMQLVIHSPFGSRINRAWGLALRKRFCRTFNFELQAAATEDTIVLSLTTAHSFELSEVARYLHPNSAREILVQALLAAPMFTTRWRWDASIALALPRFRGGKKVPPALARMNAEDLLAAVFPDQVACGENIVGDIVVPDHPLVKQTVRDCLEEAMDIDGFERLLRGLMSGEINVIARDLTEPSPLALEVLSARPYAYLDDAPLEERRTQAVASRRWMDPQSAADIGKLDSEAIARVRNEAWPDATSPDELHDALSWMTYLTSEEAERNERWPALLHELMKQRRVTRIVKDAPTLTLPRCAGEGTRAPTLTPHSAGVGTRAPTLTPHSAGVGTRAPTLTPHSAGEGTRAPTLTPHSAGEGTRAPTLTPHSAGEGTCAPSLTPRSAGEGSSGGRAGEVLDLYIAEERLPMWSAVFPEATLDPAIEAPRGESYSRDDALIEIVRGRLDALGPTTAASLSGTLGIPVADIDAALLALEAEGSAMRGRFTESAARDPGDAPPEWCNRRLLARIHRYTVKRLRAEIEPVQARDFLRFLFEWQRVTSSSRMQGPDAVASILGQLEGFEAPAVAWESEILPLRISEYDPAWLDEQCLAGRIVWTRLSSRTGDAERGASPVRSTPIVLLARRNVKSWTHFAASSTRTQVTSKAERVAEVLQQHGASFFDEILESTGLLPVQVEEALAELVAHGIVNSDSFGGLRTLLVPPDRRRSGGHARRRRRTAIFSMQDAGRWAIRRGAASAGRQSDGEGLSESQGRPASSAYRLQPTAYSQRAEAIEHLCRTLLNRWGVVFWKLLDREANWLPPWRELLLCLRRLEARGEIRGGRFIAGYSGEQFALPEAIGPLREARRKPHTNEYLSVSAADPLNLVGILTPGGRVPSLTGNRVLYCDGLPLALLVAGQVRFLQALDPETQWRAQTALLRKQPSSELQESR